VPLEPDAGEAGQAFGGQPVLGQQIDDHLFQ
jgi:hypothetical protein